MLLGTKLRNQQHIKSLCGHVRWSVGHFLLYLNMTLLKCFRKLAYTVKNYSIIIVTHDVDVSHFFRLRCDDRNRGHQYKLFLPGCRSSVRQHFLSYRAVHTWNNLPADSTDFSNLRSFKRGLNSSFSARHSAVYYF